MMPARHFYPVVPVCMALGAIAAWIFA